MALYNVADDVEATESRVTTPAERADYSGLSHARLDAHETATKGADGGGLYWPVPSPDHPGTPRAFLDTFPLPGGRARLLPVHHRGPDDVLDTAHPVHLVTGRVLQHYQSGAQTRRVPELARAVSDAYVEIHPLLAELYDVADDQLQRHNLWDDPARAALRSDLLAELHDREPPAHEPRLALEAPV